MPFSRISFAASTAPEAQAAREALAHRYGHVPAQEANVIVALGGDGFMIEILHETTHLDVPVYGMNRGTVGFLMNDFSDDDLLARLADAEQAVIHPLRMTAWAHGEEPVTALAINEVALLRQTRQAAKIAINIDGVRRMEELTADGVMVSTPAGSTAYNYSAHGPILPIGAALLALTAVAAFRPRRWRGALLPERTAVSFEVIDGTKRPVSATADAVEVRNVRRVDVALDRSVGMKLLHDPGHGLEERLIREQFA